MHIVYRPQLTGLLYRYILKMLRKKRICSKIPKIPKKSTLPLFL